MLAGTKVNLKITVDVSVAAVVMTDIYLLLLILDNAISNGTAD